jgi:hypothetical protein
MYCPQCAAQPRAARHRSRLRYTGLALAAVAVGAVLVVGSYVVALPISSDMVEAIRLVGWCIAGIPLFILFLVGLSWLEVWLNALSVRRKQRSR